MAPSGADILTTGADRRVSSPGAAPSRSAPGQVDPKWAERVRNSDRRALMRQFHHEARELHRLLSHEQHAVPPAWRDFRSFLADVGPSPGPRFQLQKLRGPVGSYRPGEVAWALVRGGGSERAGPTAAPDPASTYSQWTMISGLPVQHADVPARLGVSFGALSAATAAGESVEVVAQKARAAGAEVADLAWLSPVQQHQETFRKGFVAWRLKVLPRFATAATPQFLYLHTVVTAMVRCKAVLAEAGLWKPLTDTALAGRDASPAWKSFNELLPKATVTLAGFEIYRQYSLTEDIDELGQRIETAERRFRGA
jgi:hypothetical protein